MHEIGTFKNHPFLKSKNEIDRFGASACLALTGIKKDGSYYYGSICHGLLNDNPGLIGEDYKFANTIERIKTGTLRFEYGQKAETQFLTDLENLIILNLRRNNKVTYFFPHLLRQFKNI